MIGPAIGSSEVLLNWTLSASSSINLEANVNNGNVQVDAGSQATTYPSMAIYSYFYVDGKLVTTEVWTQKEGAPDDIKKPMQPIPDQTQPKP